MNTENKKIATVITGCIIDGRRILLTQRSEPELPEADKKWDLPGGKVEFSESTEEVVKREVKEEIGLDVEPIELVPYIHTNLWNYSDHQLHVIVMCYTCRLADENKKIKIKLDEVSHVKWVDIGDIDLAKTLPGIKEFLTWVAEEKFGIKVQTPSRQRYIYLECVKPIENTKKFFSLSDLPPTLQNKLHQLKLFDERPVKSVSSEQHVQFVVTRAWGRIGLEARFTTEEYYSEHAVIRRFSQILKKREKNGYKIVQSNMGQSFEEIFLKLEQELESLSAK